jgi:predicted TIM-barrel fold metal-dependent hydrolase
MGDPDWTAASITPWIDHCLESFGSERCMFGTNWPVDRLFSSYDAIVTAYRASVSSLSLDEQHQVLHRNARQLYRL